MSRLQHPLEHPHDDDDAAVRVVPGVEDQRLQRGGVVALGRREAGHDRLEDLLGADAFLGAGKDGALGRKTDDLFDLPARLVGLRARQVDFVDDGDDVETVVDREVRVRERLRLDPLGRINKEQRSFASGQRPGDLVREIHVPRRVDQVQDVLVPVLGLVMQADRVRLDRDPALALEIHRVEHLRFHFTGLQGAGELQKPIGQGRLAVIDVRDDREITDVLLVQEFGSDSDGIGLTIIRGPWGHSASERPSARPSGGSAGAR